MFIADGYCHSRVAVYDPKSKEIKTLVGSNDNAASEVCVCVRVCVLYSLIRAPH